MILIILRCLAVGFIFLVSFPFFVLYYLIRFHHPDNAYWYNLLVSSPIVRVFGVTWEIRNKELMDTTSPRVFVSNHQSNFDALFLATVFPKNCRVIGKKSIKYVPIFGWLFHLSGQVLINRKNRKKAFTTFGELEKSIKEEGVCAWVFPEGTRSKALALKPFKKGAFYAAIHCQVPIQPVVISSYARSFSLKKLKPAHLVFKFLPTIETTGLKEKDIPKLAEQARLQIGAHLDYANEFK